MTENIEDSFLGSTPAPWLRGVPDAYETTASHWKHSLSFQTAAARLSGLVKGSFRGIEVLKRGASPRIVAAEVLGSRGATAISGPELAGRLGLESTWAYFSVKSVTSVKPEPDHSGQAPVTTAPAPAPAAAPPAPPAVPPIAPGGGSQAPGSAPSGGAAAG
jgi:hypothetical protein